MKAILLEKPGDPSTLRLGEIALPVPAAGEVRVRVSAAGLNPIDYKFGAMGCAEWVYPHILGLDVAGTVDAVGEGVSRVKPGDRVAYLGNPWRRGGFAEYSVTSAVALAAIPDGVDDVTAAVLPTAGLTAYQIFFRKLAVRPNQTVVVFGASGGVGSFSIPLAKRVGLKVIAVGSSERAELARALGADSVIPDGDDLAARIRRVNGGRLADIVLDTLGNGNATRCLDLLVFNGALVCIVEFPDFSQLRWLERGVTVHEVALGAAYKHGDGADIADIAAMLEELLALVSTKTLRPLVAEVIPFESIPDGLERLRSRRVQPGKVVAVLS